MFRVAANGDKTFLPVPYAAILNVAADGSIWFVRNGVLSMATPQGVVTNLAPETGAAPAADGALGSSPGADALIAAGRDKVYLLREQCALSKSVPAVDRIEPPQGG